MRADQTNSDWQVESPQSLRIPVVRDRSYQATQPKYLKQIILHTEEFPGLAKINWQLLVTLLLLFLGNKEASNNYLVFSLKKERHWGSVGRPYLNCSR